MVNRPDSKKARQKRHTRVRAKISGTAECPRLNVFRSLQHIYAQIIDDVSGKTLVSASTVEKDFELSLIHISLLTLLPLSCSSLIRILQGSRSSCMCGLSCLLR